MQKLIVSLLFISLLLAHPVTAQAQSTAPSYEAAYINSEAPSLQNLLFKVLLFLIYLCFNLKKPRQTLLFPSKQPPERGIFSIAYFSTYFYLLYLTVPSGHSMHLRHVSCSSAYPAAPGEPVSHRD